MNWHELLRDAFDLYICVILTVEYFYGRSDTDLKKEEKRRAKKRPEFEHLTVGEGK
jgi:predicted nucleic acid-binding protein